ncbi:MAG: PhoH family protein, partial [Phenylobacterium sp.]|nr:PhoH family protein [Phenylobacterium sp.]
MSRAPEFIVLTDVAARAVSGTNSRHAALLEDAFGVLVETPGGGVQLSGDAKSRGMAKRAIQSLASRADQGLDINEADVRVAIGQARTGSGAAPGGLPVGRRGQVAPKTPAQARYLKALSDHPLVFGLGPAGTGKTFLAVAHGAGLLLRGEVDRLIVSRPAVEAGERLGFLPGDL